MSFLIHRLSGGSCEAINPAAVIRAVWAVAAGGHDGHLQIHLSNNYFANVPFGDPDFPVIAEALGFKAQLDAWPKQQAAARAAAAKAKADRDAQKAALKMRRAG